MITARHAVWADWIFRQYVMWLLKHHFHAIHILGEIPDPAPKLPLILLPNHSTWWDGFFVYLLNKKLFHRKLYLMMLEEQLAKYYFFSKLGVYGMEPKSGKGVIASLRYTVSIMREAPLTSPLICVFPQGELRPSGMRPLGYKRGIEWIIEKYSKTVNLLPLAIRCEFLDDQRPEVFFLFGENYQVNSETFSGISWLEKEEEYLLNKLSDLIVKREIGQVLLRGAQSVSEVWDAFVRKIRLQK